MKSTAKRSKRTSSSNSSKPPRLEVRSRAQLKELQSLMARAVFRPLTEKDGMQSTWTDGRAMADVADSFIKPNDRLTSFDRLEIYNRVYWFRVLDCLYDDYTGLRAVLGEEKFMRLITAYLAKYPSTSFTLRNLGRRLEKFILEETQWTEPRLEIAVDMAKFEWAQVVAFDDPANPVLTTDDILDASPDKLRLGLQPYLSLLELNYAVDEFFLAVKKGDSVVLRDEASNTFDEKPHSSRRQKLIKMPRRERVHLAVHRFNNSLFYKRLDPEAFAILGGLRSGLSVEDACTRAIARSTRKNANWPKQVKDWFDEWSSLGWFCQPCSK
jgi:hypothetical protein